jgi:hypothetical protein
MTSAISVIFAAQLASTSRTVLSLERFLEFAEFVMQELVSMPLQFASLPRGQPAR